MNKTFLVPTFLLLFVGINIIKAEKSITIETKNFAIHYSIGKNGKVYQDYLGEKLLKNKEYETIASKGHEIFMPFGTNNLFEPTIRTIHTDGNPSLELLYSTNQTTQIDTNISETVIDLKDPKYPFQVALHFKAYYQQDVIEQWSEITHQEKKPITLYNFASAMIHFDAQSYWLTQFHSDWAKEMQMQESKLTSGIKVIDSKLGTRPNEFQSPFFFLALNKQANENSGEVIAGSLSWTGNFRFTFEIDNENSLRIISGINPYASEYQLKPNQKFTTPSFVFAYSNQGKGLASRNLHKWTREYCLLDGNKPRLTLLNNWESTFFNFDEPKLNKLIGDASKLGVDMFLLDDGWFGNKYPRDNDNAGLGDWEVNKTKLPNGIPGLTQEAKKQGVKFGIWIEPEMVNPKSELYEKHPEWILKLPNRDEDYQRNQLVLDLSNPKVQDFVFGILDNMLTKDPQIGYFKWDCNRTMSNMYSSYLKGNQSHLFIEYTQGLYKVLDRVRSKYPHIPMMLCSSGGARVDYKALKYFTEFWPSDNTDPLERIYIQWGFSNFIPSIASCNHITSWGKQSLKYKTDVAMTGKMGYDIQIDRLSPEELLFSQNAIKTYKEIQKTIWFGDLYRLISPYEENRAALMYVDENKSNAVLFIFNLNTRFSEIMTNVKLNGLQPDKEYRIKEINLFPGTKSECRENDKILSGDYLMKVGVSSSTSNALTSSVFEISEE